MKSDSKALVMYSEAFFVDGSGGFFFFNLKITFICFMCSVCGRVCVL